MASFEERQDKVFNFMDQVQQNIERKNEEDAFQGSLDYKLKKLDQCENDAKDICLDKIFCKLYKDAVPLNDDYKNACCDDLDAEFQAFMQDKCPKGLEFYVREGLKKKNPFARKVLEAVDELVKDEFKDKAMNIEDLDAKDLPLNPEEIKDPLEDITNNLNGEEISAAIKQNVHDTALADIQKAKDQKEQLKQFEMDLANDPTIRNVAAVENALELHDLNITRDYNPSLFTTIMINKLEKISPLYESGELSSVYLYNAMAEYGKDIFAEETDDIFATAEELAFVEAVKEYTALNLLHALKFDPLTKYRVEQLKDEYTRR